VGEGRLVGLSQFVCKVATGGPKTRGDVGRRVPGEPLDAAVPGDDRDRLRLVAMLDRHRGVGEREPRQSQRLSQAASRDGLIAHVADVLEPLDSHQVSLS
jgi:hypothetical protein